MTKAVRPNLSRIALFLGGAALGLCTAGPAFAQAADDQDVDNGDIIVTASKRSEPLREVAGSVSAITGDQLSDLSARNLADYAAFVPGLSLQTIGRPGQTNVTIRGVQPLSVGASTGTYIDDVPFGSANNFTSGANLTPDLDPNDLERVELLKGPQGTLYGASSLGGLIKYVTRDPDLKDLEMRFDGGIYSVHKGGLGFNVRGAASIPLVTDLLAVRISANHQSQAGFIDDLGVGGDDTNSAEVEGFRVAALLQPVAELKIKLSALHQDIESHGINGVDVSRATLRPLFGDLTQNRLARENDSVKTRLYSGSIDHDFGFASLTSATSFSKVRANPYSDGTAYLRGTVGAGPTQFIRTLAGMHTNKWTQEVRLVSPSNGKFEWILGAFYQNEHSGTNQNYKTYNADGSPAAGLLETPYLNMYDTRYKEYAGFGNVTLYITPTLDITGGYRISHNDQSITRRRTGIVGNPASPTTFRVRSQDSSETVSTYLATLRWRPTSDVLLYARAASGYRPGGPRDIAPGSTPPPDFVYSFDADTVWNYEVGVKAEWLDGAITTDVSGYWIDWSKIQGTETISGFGVFGNVGNARVRGFEAEAAVRPIEGLRFGANVTYTDATISEDNVGFRAKKGDPLPYTARWAGAATASYDAALTKDWSSFFSAALRFSSKRYNDFSLVPARVELPGYAMLDLRMGISNADDLRLSLYMTNVTDKRAYLAVANNSAPNPRIAVAQPRTIGFSISKAF